jgi:hypothetical protein
MYLACLETLFHALMMAAGKKIKDPIITQGLKKRFFMWSIKIKVFFCSATK